MFCYRGGTINNCAFFLLYLDPMASKSSVLHGRPPGRRRLRGEKKGAEMTGGGGVVDETEGIADWTGTVSNRFLA